MTQQLYSNNWSTAFTWTATQDCWVFGSTDTNGAKVGSVISLNDAQILLAYENTGNTPYSN